ncbi:MAG: hypothetical protein AAF600_21350 [Bacteroidota bacterium]
MERNEPWKAMEASELNEGANMESSPNSNRSAKCFFRYSLLLSGQGKKDDDRTGTKSKEPLQSLPSGRSK